MTLKRVIPILLVKDGILVRSQIFKYHQAIGDPIPTIKRLSDWSVDEIIILNIGINENVDSRRDDKYHNLGEGTFSELITRSSKSCLCPLTVGGGLQTREGITRMFKAGADKIVLNTVLFTQPELVKWATSTYGAQAVVASLDINEVDNKLTVWSNKGRTNTGLSLREGVNLARKLDVGELLISSINNDGSSNGYSKNIMHEISTLEINFPLVINSGATKPKHFIEGLENSKISAVAASNVFYFTEISYYNIKKSILSEGCENIRPPEVSNKYISREPRYSNDTKRRLMLKYDSKEKIDKLKYKSGRQKDIKFCRKCLYSSASAAPMQFDSTGLCMGCKIAEVKFKQNELEYKDLSKKLEELVSSQVSKSDYDCIVSVSGGKDSYYQVYYVKEVLGLNPLLVTYNGNNYTKVGWRNLWNMRHVFDCDHIIVSPSIKTIKRLNKLAFIVMGDMNWHNHMGIFTTAPRIAIQQGIPIIFWGEHGYADLCGQFSMNDFPEGNYRERTEHEGRGFDWPFFVGLDGITSKDLTPWKYPSDEEIASVNLRQIYLGHYIPWESNKHLQLVVEKYGFQVSDEKFERTYRTGSNLDDMHENGVHDYLKYIKFGYGRCTDHASKDIRAGIMTRKEGIDLVKRMDHVKPKDLDRWLKYVNMSEEEFDRIADFFRDPRVWSLDENDQWQKFNLTD